MSLGIGNRIKELREKLEVSRAAFGEKLKITADQVRKIEVEERMPSDAVYVGLNREFGFSLDFIFTGKAWGGTSEFITMKLETPMARKAIQDLNSCAQSIKKLDEPASVGIGILEKAVDKYSADPALAPILNQIILERGSVAV